MIKNRALSFFILFAVYCISTAACVFIFPLLKYDYWLNVFVLDVIATVIVFIFSLIFRNASVYDPYWSVQPIVILAFSMCFHKFNLLGILLCCAVFLWGIRLTANWAYTFKGLTHQDWRYTMLHEKTGFFYPVINFVGIHMVPTVIVFFCILPAVEAIHCGALFTPVSGLCILLSVFAFTVQGIADVQMHSFKKNGGQGFIRNGLWKHSRHPNYLGEILMWWGIGLACFAAMPDKWYLLSGAFANTCLFLFVSIPLAENHQARKPGFEEYKKQTRVLI